MRRSELRILLCVLLIGAAAGTASANAVSYFQTEYGTDWAYAGLGGVRSGSGSGTIALGGVTGTVTRAILYWHGPTNTSDTTANANITFAGNSITGTNIGLADDNCWGYLNSQGYRADVTAHVSGNGNYAVSNLIKQNANINGLSLLVFYDDGDTTNDRDVVLFNGNDSNISSIYDPTGWQASLSGINYTGGTASMVLGVADGQNYLDEAVYINAVQVLPNGAGNFQGNTVPDGGTAGSHNGGLWDIRALDVTPLLSPGPNTLSLTTAPVYNDCLGLIHVAIDLPAGAAPPPIPEPTSLALLGLGLAGAALRRRRSRR
jgi:hypothetical protein